MLKTSILTRSERITDASFMTAEWTTVLICQVSRCVSHDGSVGTTVLTCPILGLPMMSSLCKGPQSHPARSVRGKSDMSDEDRLRSVVLHDYGMATGRELLGSIQVL